MRSLAPIRPRRAFALGAVLVIAAALAVATPVFALIVAPALLLAVFLVLGFFPGETLLERRLASRHQGKSARSTNSLVPERPNFVPRTGRRIAFALAVRPPPAVDLSPTV